MFMQSTSVLFKMKRILVIAFFFAFSTTIYSQKDKTIIKGWASYSQSINVSKKENLEFRVSAYLRKGKSKSRGKSAIWVRVDKKDNTPGFFQNDAYNENIIVTEKWQKFEINGTIDLGAEDLYFGAFCDDNGDFYFDNFKIEIKSKKGKWNTIEIANFDFEKKYLNDSWNEGIHKAQIHKTKNFTIEYSKHNPHSGEHSLFIQGKNILGNNENGKFVTVNKVKLYYEIYGQGEPLLMLHGNGQSISAFMNQVDEFSKYYKVILVDCRGRGNSTFDYKTELTYTLEANDIKLFLDKINISKTHVLGWSDGGIIGLIMAINYPDKIDKLIAIGANINPDGLKDLKGMFNTISDLEKNNIKDENNLFISLYKLMAYYPKLKYSDLNTIESSTLIMAGDQDVIKNIHTIKMYEAIKNSQLAILPNETHFFPEQNPKLFNEIVLKFLK